MGCNATRAKEYYRTCGANSSPKFCWLNSKAGRGGKNGGANREFQKWWTREPSTSSMVTDSSFRPQAQSEPPLQSGQCPPFRPARFQDSCSHVPLK